MSSVWVERYRPSKLEDLILNETNKHILESVYTKGFIPNITICSPTAGIGKTTIAKMLAKDFCDEDEILFINGSLDRNIDTIRNEMTDFVYKASFNSQRKVIIIDEADGINKIAQDSLRGFIEEWQKECSFILTCNDVSKIIPAIISRCPKMDLTVLPSDRKMIAEQIYNRCLHILRDNLIEFDEKAVKQVITNYFPDIRQIINVLQRLSLSGKVELQSLAKQDAIKTSSTFRELELAIVEKDWNKIRIWSHDNYNMDNIYNLIYDDIISKIDKDKVPDFIILTGEYVYRTSLTGYNEINLATYLTEIIQRFTLNG